MNWPIQNFSFHVDIMTMLAPVSFTIVRRFSTNRAPQFKFSLVNGSSTNVGPYGTRLPVILLIAIALLMLFKTPSISRKIILLFFIVQPETVCSTEHHVE